MRTFHLPSVPWLFVIDRHGTIRSEIAGGFGVEKLTRDGEGSDRRMSEEAASDTELLNSFAAEARRRST